MCIRDSVKGGAGAGAGLIKKRQNGLPFQGRHLFDAFGEELLHRTGRIQQLSLIHILDVYKRQSLHRPQVLLKNVRLKGKL